MEKSTTEKPKIKFRNYKPYDQSLLKSVEKTASAATIIAESIDTTTTSKDIKESTSNTLSKPVSATTPSETTTLVHASSSVLDKILAATPVDVIQQELKEMNEKLGTNELNIVPKKMNWDLKRHAEFKIEKLRKRTQRAIVEILREKLADTGDEEDAETDDDDDIDV